jgi:two-component system, LytTR family, sensor kinase
MNVPSYIYKYKLHHLPFWILFFAIWHFFRYQDYPRYPWLVTTIKVVDLATLVYITNYLLIPKLLYKKRWILFAVSFLLMIVASSVFKMYILGQVMNLPGMFDLADPTKLKVRIYDNVIPHILLVSTGSAFKLLLDNSRAQRRLAEMARQKSEAELNFLKSQINPHFLFNSLNSIYFLIDRENTEARRTLLQFSDLLRYQLYDCSSPTIEIEKEITFLKDYIRLQELRKDKNYEVDVKVGRDVKDFQITPLLLIAFVENAFKHISHHNNGKNFVHVDMNRSNGTFQFMVENSKEDQMKNTEPAGGIGLANVKRRLELQYPDRHQLKISDRKDLFKVELVLNVQ